MAAPCRPLPRACTGAESTQTLRIGKLETIAMERSHSQSAVLPKSHSDGYDLVRVHRKAHHTVAYRERTAFRFLHQIVHRGGNRTLGQGEFYTARLVSPLVQPHNQPISIFRLLQGRQHDVLAVKSDKRT